MAISGICCAIVGLVFVVAGVIFNYLVLKSKGCTGYTEAEVISVEGVRSGSTYMYRPVLYYSVDGNEYTKMLSVGSNPPKYKEGQIVTIRYDELNPKRFCVDGDTSLNLLRDIFLGLGSVALVVGVLLWAIGGVS